jgi:hypothetical protein
MNQKFRSAFTLALVLPLLAAVAAPDFAQQQRWWL